MSPTGIILKSASHEVSDEVRQKNLEAVMTSAGYEVEKPEKEAPAAADEPKRDEYKSEEEFEAAQVEYQEAHPVKETEDDEEEEEAPAAAKRPSRKQRAIDRATQQLKADLQKANDRIAALEGKKEGKTEEAPKQEPRPKRVDFAAGDDGQQKYEDALLAWGVKKATAEKALTDAEAANKSRFEQNLVSYSEQIEEAKDKYEDWDDVVNQEIFIGREVQLAILENRENAADITYYLGKHPVYAKKLGEMSPLSAVMEVGRLSARLKTGAPAPGEANGGAPQKTRPRVPAPVKPVNTSGTSSSPTFAEIAAKPAYPGKARDLKRAASAGR